jgi:hypothetical protein
LLNKSNNEKIKYKNNRVINKNTKKKAGGMRILVKE